MPVQLFSSAKIKVAVSLVAAGTQPMEDTCCSVHLASVVSTEQRAGSKVRSTCAEERAVEARLCVRRPCQTRRRAAKRSERHHNLGVALHEVAVVVRKPRKAVHLCARPCQWRSPLYYGLHLVGSIDTLFLESLWPESRAPAAQTRSWSSWHRAADNGKSRAPPRRRADSTPASASAPDNRP